MVKGSDVAEKAITEFHAQYNANLFKEMYDQASKELKAIATETEFTNLMTVLQQKLGGFKSTSEKSVNVTTGLSGTYIEFICETDFDKGKATEQFGWQISGGKATLFRYNISSPTLNINPLESQAKTDSQPSNNSENTKENLRATNSTDVREPLSLQKALLGHWISTDGKTHIYYNENRLIIVSQEGVTSRIYDVESSDEQANKLKLKVSQDQIHVLAFSADRRTLSDLIYIGADTSAKVFNWIYVDDKQHP